MDSIRSIFRETGLFLLGIFAPAARSLRENTGLAAVSVVLAFGLWILVTDAENPTRSRVLPVDLAVEPVNVPADVVVDGDVPPVRVRVRVEDHVFDSLSTSDFSATVDLEGLSVGQYELAAEVRTLSSRGGLRVEEVLPSRVDVNLAPLVSKDVTIVLGIEGAPPDGYAVNDPTTDERAARVSGPQSRVDLVTQAFAAINVAGRTRSIDQSVRLEPRDERGHLVEGVSLEPGVTSISVDITQVTYSRPVVVEPVLEGSPREGFRVTGIDVRPVTVVITGAQDLVSQVQTVKTDPIDIDDADEEVSTTVSLDLPDGASVRGTGSVDVTVNVEPIPEPQTAGPPASTLARL
jgi:YbbR domain-containing protein